MKSFSLLWAVLGLYLYGAPTPTFSQALSTNTVKYKLTYNPSTEVYTVWVHPDYNTPNANNANASEFSATAQVSLKVPPAFVIRDITDVRGVWEKDPRKLGDPAVEPALAAEAYDKAARYYAIGKSPSETNLGRFALGDSAALFTFRGNACLGPVSILAPADPFVAASVNASSLNVRASFYSRSGQPAGGNEVPREQLAARKGPDAFCDPNAQIGVAKALAGLTDNNNGSFDLAYTLKVKNTGAVALANVQVFDTLSRTFPAPATFSLVGGVATTPALPVNGSFSGTGSNTGLLAGAGGLAAGDSIMLSFTVRLIPGPGVAPTYLNVAWGQGSFNGAVVRDRSSNGSSVDPDRNGDPGDNEAPTPVVVNQQADVALSVGVSKKLPQVNETVTLRVVLLNQGQVAATGLEVGDALPVGFDLVGAAGPGSYAAGTWTPPTVAPGDSAVLLLTVRVVSMGVLYYTAQVTKMNETDVDSSPNNGVETEDDFGRACVSTPILLCASQAVELSVPAGFTNIQWFRDGAPIANQNGSKLTVTAKGTYTFTTTNSTCPTGGCCPIIVQEVDCCPVTICVPMVITRVKRGATPAP